MLLLSYIHNFTANNYTQRTVKYTKTYIHNFVHLLILPFSAFPLYAHTRLVEGHLLTLCRRSGTLSLKKSGYPTPSHPSNHHLKLTFFQQSY